MYVGGAMPAEPERCLGMVVMDTQISTDLPRVATEKAKKHPYLKFVDWNDQEGVDRVFKVIGMRYIASLTDAEIEKGVTP